MRERLAAALSVVAVALLVLLSGLFARVQNPDRIALDTAAGAGGVTEASPDAPSVSAADSIAGRAVYVANSCASCHAVAGDGNPRYPLDGVGARRTAAELRAWTVGAEVLADSLPPSAFRAKQGYQRIGAEDMAALVQYLSALRGGR